MSRSNVSSRPISPLVLGAGQGAEHCQPGAGRESATGTRKMRSRTSSFLVSSSLSLFPVPKLGRKGHQLLNKSISLEIEPASAGQEQPLGTVTLKVMAMV